MLEIFLCLGEGGPGEACLDLVRSSVRATVSFLVFDISCVRVLADLVQ